jgi:hypothetical protein
MMMRIITVLIAVLLLISGCTYVKRSEMPPENQYSKLQMQIPANSEEIRIIESKVYVARGEIAKITIQAKAGTNYSISASYNYGNNKFTSEQTKKAGADGIVSFTWEVKPETIPGTYMALITGGGRFLSTTYIVQ